MNSSPSPIITQLEDFSMWLMGHLNKHEFYDEGHQFPWENYLWRGEHFRRAHLDIVDARESKKLYMMHLCIFPHTNDPSPIFGFDIIAGPAKVTGAFHDFSPVKGGTPLDEWFAAQTEGLVWSKERTLPPWAKEIFSPSMIAAGNIQDPEELQSLLDTVKFNVLHYLRHIGRAPQQDFSPQQNKYCYNQKQNPHTPRVMSSLGFEPEVVHDFIQKCLFPEI